MSESENDQRSQCQWEMYRLNLIAGGAIIAFAVKMPHDFEHALLVLPVLSLLLFLYWVHHGFVIRLQASDYVPRKLDTGEMLRRGTILPTILGNFAGFPVLAISLYSRDGYSWFVWVDYGCIAIVVVLFFVWMHVQYSQRFADSLQRDKLQKDS